MFPSSLPARVAVVTVAAVGAVWAVATARTHRAEPVRPDPLQPAEQEPQGVEEAPEATPNATSRDLEAIEVDPGSGASAERGLFSPSADAIAVELDRGTGTTSLALATATDHWALEPLRLPHGPGPIRNPTWHPSGILVAEGGVPNGARLYYSVPPGRMSELITLHEANGALSEPATSPVGSDVVFVRGGDLVIRRTIDGTLVPLLHTPDPEVAPSFTPRGTVLFERGGDLFEWSEADGELPRVAGPRRARLPIERGSRLFWYESELLADVATGPVELWTQEGRARRRIAEVRLGRGAPAVDPTGRWIAYIAFDDPDAVVLERTDGSARLVLDPGLRDLREPTLEDDDAGQLWLAFTASSGPRQRSLHVAALGDVLPKD